MAILLGVVVSALAVAAVPGQLVELALADRWPGWR